MNRLFSRLKEFGNQFPEESNIIQNILVQSLLKFLSSGLNLMKLFGTCIDAQLRQDNGVRHLNRRLNVI